jgi:3-hydroxyacyl-CoA dehydrogenase
LTKDDKAVRNRIATENFEKLKKASPALLYSPNLQTESKLEISMMIYQK